MTAKAPAQSKISKPRKRRAPACPECGSRDTARVLHGYITPRRQRAVDRGEAIISDREEWEGMTQWYCKACGCDWGRHWRRFKRGGSINATR